jgi:hypothetical protein
VPYPLPTVYEYVCKMIYHEKKLYIALRGSIIIVDTQGVS